MIITNDIPALHRALVLADMALSRHHEAAMLRGETDGFELDMAAFRAIGACSGGGPAFAEGNGVSAPPGVTVVTGRVTSGGVN